MDAEKLILTKQYHELTANELELVSEYASNQEEFIEMKQFFISTKNTLQTDKIIASEQLNSNILNHLNSPIQNHQPWYNSLFVFLFPRDRSFYQYPAFQMAITALVVFGVFNLFNTDLKESNLALNETPEEKVLSPEIEIVQEQKLVEELEKSEELKAKTKVFSEKEVLLDNENVIPLPAPVLEETASKTMNEIVYFDSEEEVAEEIELEMEDDVVDFRSDFDKVSESVNQSIANNSQTGAVSTTVVENKDVDRKKKDIDLNKYKKENTKIVTEKNEATAPMSTVISSDMEVVNDEILKLDDKKSIGISVKETSELNQLFFVVN
jgi:hypothetical protein